MNHRNVIATARTLAATPNWTLGSVIRALEGFYGPGTYEWVWSQVAGVSRPAHDDEQRVVQALVHVDLYGTTP